MSDDYDPWGAPASWECDGPGDFVRSGSVSPSELEAEDERDWTKPGGVHTPHEWSWFGGERAGGYCRYREYMADQGRAGVDSPDGIDWRPLQVMAAMFGDIAALASHPPSNQRDNFLNTYRFAYLDYLDKYMPIPVYTSFFESFNSARTYLVHQDLSRWEEIHQYRDYSAVFAEL